MIIPKAIFLYYTYRKGLYGKFDCYRRKVSDMLYEVNAPILLETWPESDRQRVWVSTFLKTIYFY